MFKTTKDLLTGVRMKPVGRNRNDLWAAWKEPVAMLRDVCVSAELRMRHPLGSACFLNVSSTFSFFFSVFFFPLNYSCWCEKQVGSVKANSCYILSRKGGNM